LKFYDGTLQFLAFLAEIWLEASEKVAGESLTGLGRIFTG